VVIAIAALLTVGSATYSVRNFSINTDVNKLISPDLPWRQRELAVDKAFPGRHQRILAVVDAPTSELATQASDALVEKLKSQPKLFPSVREPGGSDFFVRNSLLFLPAEQVKNTLNQFTQAQPLIRVLVSDPSWRGLSQSLSYALVGLQRKFYTLDQMARPLNMFAVPLERWRPGSPRAFPGASWWRARTPPQATCAA
jgi:hypothetical protein